MGIIVVNKQLTYVNADIFHNQYTMAMTLYKLKVGKKCDSKIDQF
jgi:hypothetical protein